MQVKIVKPIGHCFGVINAINLAKEIRNKYLDKNVYVFGMLVHNEEVLSDLEKLNIKTVNFTKENANELLSKFTTNDVVIFSAHGHDKKYEEILKNNNVTYFDATCERVKKSFELIKQSHEIIYIGKKNHPEANAALSMNENTHFYDINNDFDFTKVQSENPVVINQTTLSFLELEEIHQNILNHLPNANILDEICDATLLRQLAVKNLENEIDLILIIGSKNSSNTRKLYEVAKSVHLSKTVHFIENIADLDGISLDFNHAALISGTSTPLNLILKIQEYLENK